MPCPPPLSLSRRPGTEVPGYTGHVPYKEQVYGETFATSNNNAAQSATATAKGKRSRSVSRENQQLQSIVCAGSYRPTDDKARFFRVGRSGRNPPSGPDTNSGAWSASLRSGGDGEKTASSLTTEWKYLRSPAFESMYAPKDSLDQSRSLSHERKIAGYAGHIPRVRSENVFGMTFRAANESACSKDDVESRSRSLSPLSGRAKTPRESWSLGYMGYTPRVRAENIYGRTNRSAYKYGQSLEKEVEMNGAPHAIPLKPKQTCRSRDAVDSDCKSRSKTQSLRAAIRSVTPRKNSGHVLEGSGPQKGPENVCDVCCGKANDSKFPEQRPSAKSSRSARSVGDFVGKLECASSQKTQDIIKPSAIGDDCHPTSIRNRTDVPQTLTSAPSYRSPNCEDRPPFGRESTGEIPSFIDHVPRKNRMGETPRMSPREPSLKKTTRSLSPRPLNRDTSNYAGHAPRVGSDNVYGVSHATANQISSLKNGTEIERESSIRSRSSQCSDLQQIGRSRIPGYAGYIPKKGPCNILGATFGMANERAAAGVDPVTAAETEAILLQRALS